MVLKHAGERYSLVKFSFLGEKQVKMLTSLSFLGREMKVNLFFVRKMSQKCHNNLIIFLRHFRRRRFRSFSLLLRLVHRPPFFPIHVKIFAFPDWNCRRHFAKTHFPSIYYIIWNLFIPSSLARRFSPLCDRRNFFLNIFYSYKNRTITSENIFSFIFCLLIFSCFFKNFVIIRRRNNFFSIFISQSLKVWCLAK